MDFCTQLINEVKKYTMLYNTNSQGYFNTKKKERVWTIIAKRINSEVPLVKQKWKHLRDMYMRFKKRMESATPPARNRLWKYYKMLNFLDDYAPKKAVEWEALVEVDKEGSRKDNVNRLIEEVQKYEVIYNFDAPGYTDRDNKEEIWKEISERINIDIVACKHKWKGLRDSYKRFQRKSVARNEQSKWKYYDALNFLERFIYCRSYASASAGNSANDSSMSPTYKIASSTLQDEDSLMEFDHKRNQLENDISFEEEFIKEDSEEDFPVDEIESPNIAPKESYVLEENQEILNISETNSRCGKEFYCLEVQNALEESGVDESRIVVGQPQEVPILYLNQHEDSSNDSLSIASGDEVINNNTRKRSAEPEFIEIFKKSMHDYAAYSIAENNDRNDSLSILFDALAYSIKNSQLDDDKLMALQSDICAFAYGQLATYKSSLPSSSSSQKHANITFGFQKNIEYTIVRETIPKATNPKDYDMYPNIHKTRLYR